MNSLWAERKLYQGLVTTSIANIYSPSLTQTGQVRIENIFLANDAAVNARFALWSGPTATGAMPPFLIFPHVLVLPHELWCPKVVLYLGYQESIWVVSDIADALTLVLNGGTRQ